MLLLGREEVPSCHPPYTCLIPLLPSRPGAQGMRYNSVQWVPAPWGAVQQYQGGKLELCVIGTYGTSPGGWMVLCVPLK